MRSAAVPNPPSVTPAGHRRHVVALAVAVAAVAALIAWLALGRGYLGYGTESDFLDGFVREARRLLQGQPLQVEFHPPLYASALAAVQAVVGDWFRSGLLLSWLSAVAALAASAALFDRLAGRSAAWGSVLVLGTSHAFLQFAAQATSDVFFLALYMAAILAALLAVLEGERRRWWLALGLAIGACLLTRTNGLTLLVFMATPWLLRTSPKQTFLRFGWVVTGVALPLIAWAAVSTATGAPFAPSGTYANLAMTYFGPGDRLAAEDRILMEQQFESVWQVLSHDPPHMIRRYATDLFTLPYAVFAPFVKPLMLFPLGLFALPGVLILFFAPAGRFKTLLALATVLQIALLNLKTFESRYYLFLVPLLGAGVGLTWAWLSQRFERRAALGIVVTVGIYTMASALLTVKRVHIALNEDESEIRTASEATRRLVPPRSTIVTRKPHIPHYADGVAERFPQATTVAALRDSLVAGTGPPADFLYFGSQEASRRPGLEELLDPARAPPWLKPLASDGQGEWVLYEIGELRGP